METIHFMKITKTADKSSAIPLLNQNTNNGIAELLSADLMWLIDWGDTMKGSLLRIKKHVTNLLH